ncbi:MAG TPA: lysoplasmalogenase, partial [Desulfatiglandales bacterium]|nr:lysoplasmalogenase [Desulfatiglandales bacterium]
MLNTLIIVLAAILLPSLLYYENRVNQKGLLLTKSVLSLLFVIAALVQPHPISVYYYCLLVGLTFCLGGDIFLALRQKMMFLFGLIFFLIGHIFYIFGFFYVAQSSQWTWVGFLTVLVISVWIYFWLKPYLRSMKAPVVLYIIIITIMLSGAWSVLGDSNLAQPGRIMVFAGA